MGVPVNMKSTLAVYGSGHWIRPKDRPAASPGVMVVGTGTKSPISLGTTG